MRPYVPPCSCCHRLKQLYLQYLCRNTLNGLRSPSVGSLTRIYGSKFPASSSAILILMELSFPEILGALLATCIMIAWGWHTGAVSASGLQGRVATPRPSFLMVVLLVPTLTPAVSVSLFLQSAESEAACEDIEECLTTAEAQRSRKHRFVRAERLCINLTVGAAIGKLAENQSAAHCFGGHRLPNGILAPLRC